jgi:hypothetical protein
MQSSVQHWDPVVTFVDAVQDLELLNSRTGLVNHRGMEWLQISELLPGVNLEGMLSDPEL